MLVLLVMMSKLFIPKMVGNDSVDGDDANSVNHDGSGNDSVDGDDANSVNHDGSGNDSVDGDDVNSVSHNGSGNDSVDNDDVNSVSHDGSGNDGVDSLLLLLCVLLSVLDGQRCSPDELCDQPQV